MSRTPPQISLDPSPAFFKSRSLYKWVVIKDQELGPSSSSSLSFSKGEKRNQSHTEPNITLATFDVRPLGNASRIKQAQHPALVGIGESKHPEPARAAESGKPALCESWLHWFSAARAPARCFPSPTLAFFVYRHGAHIASCPSQRMLERLNEMSPKVLELHRAPKRPSINGTSFMSALALRGYQIWQCFQVPS